ncbi:MAG: hypothetical protein HFG40_03115 [Bacilli bacterium]|nr:hypothetical protein [Bacilli bacterium]
MSFLRNYILDEEFQIQYFRQQLNVKNYIKINYMEDRKVSLLSPNGTIVIHGDNLRVKKLLDSEILIGGKIELIELKQENHA